MFRPGELDQKIKFVRPCLSDDGIGGQNVNLTVIDHSVWAKVRPLSGKEIERFDKLNAEELTLFVTRYRTDVNEGDRIQYRGIEFNIRRIPFTDSRAMYTEFYAERGVAQ